MSQEEVSETKSDTPKTTMMIASQTQIMEQNPYETQSETCTCCNQQDDKNHRMNHCAKFNEFNFYNSNDKIAFENVYSSDIDTLRNVIHRIEMVWNTKLAHGTMIK